MKAVIDRQTGTPIADFNGLDGLLVRRIVDDLSLSLDEGLLKDAQDQAFIKMSDIPAWQDYLDETNMPGIL